LLDLRLYRLAFAPALAALVVMAFSLDGVPDPVEPGPVTFTFEGGRAAAAAREIVALGDDRSPGSEADLAAADLVRERFEALESGTVAEQDLDVEIDGSEETLRNIVLTLPGTSERSLIIIAGRDSRSGAGATTSAAATGVLLELAQQLGVADRNRTLILASTDGASAGAEGARELLDAQPDPGAVEAVLVIAQPSAAEPAPPHLLVSSTEERNPGAQLVATAEAQLGARAEVEAGLSGPFAQLARLALPGAAGEQAAAGGAGFDAVAVSSAGEAPVPPEHDDAEALDPALLSDYGSAVLATLAAVDSRPAELDPSPETYLRFAGNIVPGWTLVLLALTLLVPPAALAVSELARGSRRGEPVARAWRWALGWLVPPAAALLVLFAMGLVGLIPSPPLPYDPTRFAVGPGEVIVLLVVTGVAGAAWWTLGLRRLPTGLTRATLAAGCAAVAVLACATLWIANPYLALLLVGMPHLVALHGLRPGIARVAAIPVAALAALPLAAALAAVASALDWGVTTPWHLALLVTGGGSGPLETPAALGTLAAAAALVWASIAPDRRRTPNRGAEPAKPAVPHPADA
jgi:hypothetical protein